ncbi:hypothetical protein HK105_207209 [Polyrhizophydium stewartii]|uniref:Lipase n=1 Tax=Polyrhizophydium stewartii TaxID=2732419 RepID=A0ABR4N1D6_9FUNG
MLAKQAPWTDRDFYEAGESAIIADLAKLHSAREFIKYWGYPCEEHSAVCRDGFVLGLQRIPGPRGGTTSDGHALPFARPPVVVWHGLSISSDVFVCNVRPDRNLAMVLADAGFDVWLANSRGNKYSNGHTALDPSRDRSHGTQFWDFAIDELSQLDMPAVVDHVLAQTGHRQLAYIGYSQGTAQAFAALSLCADLNSKIHTFVALAPAMKPMPISSSAVGSMLHVVDPHMLFGVFGKHSFLPLAGSLRSVLPLPVYAAIIELAFRVVFGWRCDRLGSEERKRILFRNVFSDSSVKSVVHWFQIINGRKFRPFASSHAGLLGLPLRGHTQMRDLVAPYPYPTKHITTKHVHLFCGGSDNISDVAYLEKHLPDHAKIHVVEDYEHLDFLWATDARHKVWDRVIAILKSQ